MVPMRQTVLLACLVLMGCAPKYSVSVNSFAAPTATAYRTYFILPADERVAPSDLEFNEFAWYVHRVLMQRGLQPARTIEEAQVAVLLDYGVGEPKEHTVVRSLPVWGQTGIASATTTGSISVYGNQAQLHAQTNYTPQYGVTGYTTKVENYTTYAKFATLRAVDVAAFRATRNLTEIWKTQIVSGGTSADLRQVFPVMVAAAADLVVTSTGRFVQRELREDSPIVIWMRTVPTLPPQSLVPRAAPM